MRLQHPEKKGPILQYSLRGPDIRFLIHHFNPVVNSKDHLGQSLNFQQGLLQPSPDLLQQETFATPPKMQSSR